MRESATDRRLDRRLLRGVRERLRERMRIRGRQLVLLRRALAVVLLLTAGWYALPAHSGSASRTKTVLTASRDLAPGTRLGPQDVTGVRMPKRLVPERALRRRERATGEIMARAARRGEPLTDLSLLDDPLTELTTGDETEAAVAIRAADEAVAELLHPGLHVDIVGSRSGNTRILAERATVVAVHPSGRNNEGETVVVVGLEHRRAADVAAAALHESVTMTLR
ncbi:Flp pilus assembly protein CpaB [Actinopolyspora mzabensis]|uniref:Flp pilus assembly protein CpaB n=1 Tax=Actinopolyspora mzabensis TaxID=995066 RepID=A0A1G9CTW3_ACTMZ|nr:SAF domain-containing protein [Actinopolyspora mzabensis]SDK55098.1 Flp pilus assembly protein CpaB [Actinopolyspora mzabensis]